MRPTRTERRQKRNAEIVSALREKREKAAKIRQRYKLGELSLEEAHRQLIEVEGA